MTRIDWNTTGTRFFEAGVDRGVLYVDSESGVPWTGLISVDETPTGGEATAYYLDGVKYLNMASSEEFEATIKAYTYPAEFGLCDGTAQLRPGLFVSQQRRKVFGFTYRTLLGNDLNDEMGYKIHLVYNALATPTQKTNATRGSSSDASDFSWKITTRPMALSGYKRTAHLVVDSRYTDPISLDEIERALYGTDDDPPRLPDFDEMIALFDVSSVFTVTDHGDGTYTVSAPSTLEAIDIVDEDSFQITWPTANPVDADSFTVSS